jgi:hypothetical protein
MASWKYVELAKEDQTVMHGLEAVVTLESGATLRHASYHPAEAHERVMKWVNAQQQRAERLGKTVTYEIHDVKVTNVGSILL